jgi:hypothetical protein
LLPLLTHQIGKQTTVLHGNGQFLSPGALITDCQNSGVVVCGCAVQNGGVGYIPTILFFLPHRK